MTNKTSPTRHRPFRNGVAVLLLGISGLAAAQPIGWWKGDGNALDSAGANHGAAVGAPTYRSGSIGQAFSMNGASQYVDLGNSSSLRTAGGPFSVSAWAYLDGQVGTLNPQNPYPNSMSIVDKMAGGGVNLDGWRLIKEGTNNEWMFCLGGGTANQCFPSPFAVKSLVPATANQWTHVTAVRGTSSFSLYVNGVLQESKPLPTVYDSDTANLRIGSYVGQGAFWFGAIDDVRYFNCALSATAVAAVYNGSAAGNCTDASLPVAIDVRPRKSPNRINSRSHGVVKVAILSRPGFNATDVDPSTVRFGRAGTEASPRSAKIDDVNRDRVGDLVLKFRISQTGLQCGDTTALLYGKTFGGQSIAGSDTVVVTGCRSGRPEHARDEDDEDEDD